VRLSASECFPDQVSTASSRPPARERKAAGGPEKLTRGLRFQLRDEKDGDED
jgi:hypothetical protein